MTEGAFPPPYLPHSDNAARRLASITAAATLLVLGLLGWELHRFYDEHFVDHVSTADAASVTFMRDELLALDPPTALGSLSPTEFAGPCPTDSGQLEAWRDGDDPVDPATATSYYRTLLASRGWWVSTGAPLAATYRIGHQEIWLEFGTDDGLSIRLSTPATSDCADF